MVSKITGKERKHKKLIKKLTQDCTEVAAVDTFGCCGRLVLDLGCYTHGCRGVLSARHAPASGLISALLGFLLCLSPVQGKMSSVRST